LLPRSLLPAGERGRCAQGAAAPAAAPAARPAAGSFSGPLKIAVINTEQILLESQAGKKRSPT